MKMACLPLLLATGSFLMGSLATAVPPAPTTRPAAAPLPREPAIDEPTPPAPPEKECGPTKPRAPVPSSVRRGDGDAVGMTVTPYPTRAVSSLVNITYGDLPIILSAPHDGTSQPDGVPARVDDGTSDFTTVRDTNTRLITEKLAAAIEQQLGRKPYVVVARFSRVYIDANREPALAYQSPNAAVHYWAYHQALQHDCDEIRARFGRGIIIDIHGQGSDAGIIYRGTRTGATFGHLIRDFGTASLVGPHSIIGQMEAKGYVFSPKATASGIGTETMLNGGFITYNYGAQIQGYMDAIQFETGGDFRNTTAEQDKSAADLAASIADFYRTYLAPQDK